MLPAVPRCYLAIDRDQRCAARLAGYNPLPCPRLCTHPNPGCSGAAAAAKVVASQPPEDASERVAPSAAGTNIPRQPLQVSSAQPLTTATNFEKPVMSVTLTGFNEDRMPLKLLYTCAAERAGAQRFVAKPRTPQRVLTMSTASPASITSGSPSDLAESSPAGAGAGSNPAVSAVAGSASTHTSSGAALGVVDLGACLSELLRAAPEVADAAAVGDFTVYSRDHTEPGAPLQPHGRLSVLSGPHAEQQWLTGLVCASELCPRMLEVELHLSPRVKPSTATAVPAAVMPPYTPASATVTPTPQLVSSPGSCVPPSSPPMLRRERRHDEPQAAGTLKLSLTDLEAATHGPAPDMVSGPVSHLGSVKSSSSSFRAPKSTSDVPRRIAAFRSDGLAGSQCQNCGILETRSWRKIFPENEKPMILCNACGLWFKNKREMRPERQWLKQRKQQPERWPSDESELECSTPQDSPGTSPEPQAVSLTTPNSKTFSPRADVRRSVSGAMPSLENDQNQNYLSPTLAPAPQGKENRWAASRPVLAQHAATLPDNQKTPTSTNPGASVAARYNTIPDPIAYSDINMPTTPRSGGRTLAPQLTPGINDIADLLFTPKRRPDGALGGSGSTRRWLSRFINLVGVEDELSAEAYMPKPDCQLDFELRVHDLHVDMASSSSMPSSPPSSSLCYDVPESEPDRVLPPSPVPVHKRRRLGGLGEPLESTPIYASD